MNVKIRFCRLFFFSFLVSLCAVALFNYFINPYGIFSSPLLPNINIIKPRPNLPLHEIKLENALHKSPKAIILGNSRADIGFDPQYPAWPVKNNQVYNLAVPGAGISTSAEQVIILHDYGIYPEVILIGLEFLDFLAVPKESTYPVNKKPVDWQFRHLQLQLRSLLTLQALGDSIKTILIQRQSNPAVVTPQGFNPLLDYIEITRTEGYFALFRQRGLENARRFKSIPRTVPNNSSDFQALDSILESARTPKAHVFVIIYPYHIQLLLMFKHYDLLSAFRIWKEMVWQHIVAARQSGINVELWDFSGVNRFSTEAIPPRGDHYHINNWYWEAGHFKKALGDEILSRLFSKIAIGNESFGVRIEEQSTLVNLQAKLEQDLTKMQQENTLITNDISEIIQTTDAQ